MAKNTLPKDLKAADVQAKVVELKTELFDKKRELHAGELKSPHVIKQIRRNIARALTLQSQAQDTAAPKEEE